MKHVHSKAGRWAKVGLSAAIVPTLMVGLVAFERVDTGTPTADASTSLQLVRHNRDNQEPARSNSLLNLRVGAPELNLRVGAPELNLGVGASGRGNGNGNGNGAFTSAVARGEALARQSVNTNRGQRQCRRAIQRLEAGIDRLEALLDRGNLSGRQEQRVRELIRRLNQRIAQIRDLCRIPSGT